MIEIKSSKAQFKRIMTNLKESGCLVGGRCVLGKNYTTCPALNGKEPLLTCPDCLDRNIKHVGNNINIKQERNLEI